MSFLIIGIVVKFRSTLLKMEGSGLNMPGINVSDPDEATK